MGSDRLDDPLRQQARTIAELSHRAEAARTPNERAVRRVHRWVARPGCAYGLVLGVLGWMALNLAAPLLGWKPLDAPPFSYLNLVVSSIALLLTMVVVIVQAQEAVHSERRAHLDLQANLLTEHKVSKVISLLEELRRDLPDVKNRRDAEAERLQESADAHEAVEILDQSMRE